VRYTAHLSRSAMMAAATSAAGGFYCTAGASLKTWGLGLDCWLGPACGLRIRVGPIYLEVLGHFS